MKGQKKETADSDCLDEGSWNKLINLSVGVEGARFAMRDQKMVTVIETLLITLQNDSGAGITSSDHLIIRD